MPEKPPKRKTSAVKEAKGQIHSGSVLFGMAAGVALLWSYEAWQRSQVARARMLALARPMPVPFRSAAAAPIATKPCSCSQSLMI
ncbi:hypothetical protein MUP77_18965 [Candidatus Bathyarchaeota archaeon]|nr:hypothetical protein [Candidatus Bathyarchaeota archaeon]